MSRYVAESVTTDAGCFRPIGLCQLCTKCLPKHPASVAIDSAICIFSQSVRLKWMHVHLYMYQAVVDGGGSSQYRVFE